MTFISEPPGSEWERILSSDVTVALAGKISPPPGVLTPTKLITGL